MKKIQYAVIAVLCCVFVISCNDNQNAGVQIKGTIDNAEVSYLNLSYKGFRDTIALKDDGTFEYRTNLSEPEFVSISYKESSNKLFLLIDTADQLTITANALHMSNASVNGSQSFMLLKEIQDVHMKNLQIRDTLHVWFNTQIQEAKTDVEKIDSIRKIAEEVYYSLVDTESEFIKKFVTENVHSMISMTALFQSFDNNAGKPLLLENPNNIQYFEMVDSSMRKNYPNATKTQEFHNAVNSLKANLEKLAEHEKRKNEKLKIGDRAPNFTLAALNGENIALSDYTGRYVLLDFWAAWCKPCREENPNIVHAYNKYKDKKFDVLQISLDKDYMSWQKAITQDGLLWKGHCSDFLAWASPVLETYGVNAIPSNFLIDPHGVIVAVNLRGSQLHQQLDMIFSQK